MFIRYFLGNSQTKDKLNREENCIILNDVHIGDNCHLENCIIESRDTIRPNTEYIGQNGEIKIAIEKNERFPM